MARSPELQLEEDTYGTEAFLGPWRMQGHGEKVDPSHVSQTPDGPLVPVRIYGMQPSERDNGNGHSKKNGNGHGNGRLEISAIPNQAAVTGETVVPSSETVVFVAPKPPSESPKIEQPRGSSYRPWGSHMIAGIQIKGPGRARGVHLSR